VPRNQPSTSGGQHENHDVPVGLLKAVQDATKGFFDVNAAMATGYGSLGSCVTGPELGAMGIHYGNPRFDR
jgi:hypothetical protein